MRLAWGRRTRCARPARLKARAEVLGRDLQMTLKREAHGLERVEAAFACNRGERDVAIGQQPTRRIDAQCLDEFSRRRAERLRKASCETTRAHRYPRRESLDRQIVGHM